MIILESPGASDCNLVSRRTQALLQRCLNNFVVISFGGSVSVARNRVGSPAAKMLEPQPPIDTASSKPSGDSVDDGSSKNGADEHTDDSQSGQLHQAPQTPKEAVQRQMKRVVGPRVYSMITGETSPLENRQINLLMANLKELPEHIRDQLMKAKTPVTDLVQLNGYRHRWLRAPLVQTSSRLLHLSHS